MEAVGKVHGDGERSYVARLIGAFSLSRANGESVMPRSRRARALVGFLILSAPHTAGRDRLATLLWSERGDEQARASLRQALLDLRPLVGPNNLIEVTRDSVRLRTDRIDTDLARFDHAVETDDLTNLADLFGEADATLLSDMHDLDPAFDEWLQQRRVEWRDARRASALRVCQGAAAARAPMQALRLAQRVAQADPLDEMAAVVVMERARTIGDIATIRRSFTTLTEALRRDLNVAPARGTIVAYERLSASGAPASVGDPPPVQSLTFDVGRHWRISERWQTVLGFGALGAGAVGLALVLHPAGLTRPPLVSPDKPVSTGSSLPSDPIASALFLQARDNTAKRTATDLGRAVTELQRVTHSQPRFAPAYAALADAYLLAGEAGSLSEAVAFDGAEHAADAAQALDPQLSSAHRAKAFILYWWQHRAAAAGEEFRNAIRSQPSDALAHFWYANVLADAGQQAEAMREFDRARLADPGSDQIATDFAWALWIFGHDDEARMRLAAIVAAHPDNVEARDCVSVIALADGDGSRFISEYRRRAELRGEPAMVEKYRQIGSAYRRGGMSGLLTMLTDIELSKQGDEPYPDHSTAAFYATLNHDRAAFMRILSLAKAAHERWGATGYVNRELIDWAGDAAALAAIGRLRGDRVEPDGPS